MKIEYTFPAKETFLAWLAGKDDNETFPYANPRDCCIARFLKDTYPEHSVEVDPYCFSINHSKDIKLPNYLIFEYNDIEDPLISGSMKVVKEYFLGKKNLTDEEAVKSIREFIKDRPGFLL
jgi:hypothetical protein